MADTLGDLAHMQEWFSTRPAEEDIIGFQVLDYLFTVKADPLGYLVGHLESFTAGPTEKSLVFLHLI
jgi:hypothetical protein